MRGQLENSGMLVGYSGQAALRMEQCDMTPESQTSGARRDGCCYPVAMNTHGTMEELMDAVSSMRSVSYQILNM
jgi:hypothetical protein